MKTATTVLQVWIRGGGVIMIGLGLLFWTGNADLLIPLHMLLGITLVLALWALAALGAVARVGLRLVALALVWGAITPVLGLTQTQLLSGSGHWLIQVAHLMVGLGVIGLGDTLARRIKRNRAPRQSASHATVVEGVTP
ncbi:MAG: hypothetical protein C5B60_09375 [Chloroflexi bacterium]|nr:MAG: hypothetical protein C5B60_09375 [Chloroflexota bacterium]